jgi:hypothetical protein
MPRLYDNPDQEALHLKAVQSLALETGREFALVKRIYETELERLRADAQVTDFLALLTSRRARERLRRPEPAASN